MDAIKIEQSFHVDVETQINNFKTKHSKLKINKFND